jgi:hypothetical protein
MEIVEKFFSDTFLADVTIKKIEILFSLTQITAAAAL